MLLLCTWRVAPYAERDHVFQFKALEQYLAGESPSFNHLVQPVPEDLATDRTEFITWWAPGGPLALYPLRRLGLAPGPALRVLVLTGILLGAAGWAHWYRCFRGPLWVPCAVALFFPWLRFASANLYAFSAEILLFATVPWLLVAAWQWHGRPGLSTGLALGLGLGFLYVLKYTGAFVAVGCLGALWWIDRRRWHARLPGWMALGVGCAAPILALTILNRHFGGAANLVTQSLRWNFSPAAVFYLLANPPLMLADLNSVLSWLLQHPAHGVSQGFVLTAGCGFVLSPVLVTLVVTAGLEPVEQFAAALLVVAAAALLAVWTFSWGGSHEPRHLAGASLAFAPTVLACGWRILRQGTTPLWWRGLVAATLGLVWVAPLLYGPVTVIGKTLSLPTPTLSATGLRDPAFPAATQASALAFLRDRARDGDVWLFGFGNTTFEIPGRHLLHNFFNSDAPEEYAGVRFGTQRAVHVHLLVDRALEDDGRGRRLRAQFQGRNLWTRESVPGSNLDLWSTNLFPAPNLP